MLTPSCTDDLSFHFCISASTLTPPALQRDDGSQQLLLKSASRTRHLTRDAQAAATLQAPASGSLLMDGLSCSGEPVRAVSCHGWHWRWGCSTGGSLLPAAEGHLEGFRDARNPSGHLQIASLGAQHMLRPMPAIRNIALMGEIRPEPGRPAVEPAGMMASVCGLSPSPPCTWALSGISGIP